MPDRDAVFAKVRAALRQVLGEKTPADVELRDRLVDDLGLDSMNVASLTIALEDQFDDVLLLNDWIAGARNPSELTVGSLVDYVATLLAETG
jgi:acyl carrier protein